MSKLILHKLVTEPSTPSAGKVVIFIDANGDAKVKDENGVVSGFDKIYGSNYNKSYNTQTLTNTSDIPALYTSMVMSSVPAGATVKIEAFSVWNMSVTNKLFNAILYVNGIEIGSLSEKTTSTATGVRNPRMGFFFFENPTLQDLTVELKFAPESAGPTATMYYGAIEGKRVQ